MRKLITSIALVLALVGALPLTAANPTHNLVAVTTTATGTTIPTQGVCTMATVWSASSSTASIVFEQSADGTTWSTMATFTDPSSTATSSAYYWGKYSRLRVDTRSAGTLSGDLFWAPCTLFPTSITSFNNITFTKPASTATFTLTAGKTFAVAKTLTLTGTDSTTHTFPSTSSSTARIDAAQTFAGVNTHSAVDIFSAGFKLNVAAKATDGAIASAPSNLFITKASALGSSTIATPTATTHDGYIVRLVSTTAFAHVISCASGKINGGTTTTVTFTSATIGDSVTLMAYQGVWYVVATTGTITLS